MKSPRTVAYLALIYSGIFAVSLTVLSIMSLTAYGCGFDFKQSSVSYMLYLIYYRSARCYSKINWRILDGINENIPLQPIMPSETHAVFRTLIFSIFYLILSIFLVITCILAFAGLRRTGKSRHFVFWLYFAPFIIIFVAIIVMDLLSSGFYIYDYFSSLSVNGLIRILEIRNSDEIRPILERISISTRSLPAIIMFGITSNAILILIFNVFLVFVFSPAAWQVCAANQNIVKVLRKMEHKKSSRARSLKRPKSPTIPTVSRRTHQVNLTVSPVQQYPKNQNEEQIQNDQQKPSIETQPPFNPYMNSQQKQETHF